MRAPEFPARLSPGGGESGAVLVLSSTFVFLLTYLALSTVDLAAVEARLADAVRVQASARTLLDAAYRVVVPGETARLQQALARGDAPVCETVGFCEGELRALTLDDSDTYKVRYQTRVRGSASAGGGRLAQAAVSSHVHYQSRRYEIDIRVVRVADNAVLARAAVGVHVSAARGEGG